MVRFILFSTITLGVYICLIFFSSSAKPRNLLGPARKERNLEKNSFGFLTVFMFQRLVRHTTKLIGEFLKQSPKAQIDLEWIISTFLQSLNMMARCMKTRKCLDHSKGKLSIFRSHCYIKTRFNMWICVYLGVKISSPTIIMKVKKFMFHLRMANISRE